MIDSIQFTSQVRLLDLNWKYFSKINSKKNKKKKVYKAQVGPILFNYYRISKTLLIISNIHRVLNKTEITINDLNEFMNKIYSAVNKVVDKEDIQLAISRIDFCG